MKLRIQGNSIRLRVSRSELARFVDTGILEETVRFGRDQNAKLTYSLVRSSGSTDVDVMSCEGRVAVLLPADTALTWAETDQVGISADVDLGAPGNLSILVEKDFACLDRSDADNADTFPNPLADTHIC
jgi:hypothetical protein